MRHSFAHEDHDIMTNLNLPRSGDHGKQRAIREFHETRVKPSRETLQPSRRLIQLVNRDAVFKDAKHMIGLFPQVAYKLVSKSSLESARRKVAFVLSLFETNYFAVDQKGTYDPSIPGNQERARNMLMALVYGNKPIYLTYAGPYFFKHYPEERQALEG